MLKGDAETTDTADDRSNDDVDTEFETTPASDDELYAVVDSALLGAALAVFDPVDADVQLRAESGEGICLKTRTDDGYYVEVHLRTGQLTAFQPDDRNRSVAVDDLAVALFQSTGDTVALHGQSDGGQVLRDGEETYDIGTPDVPLGNDHTSIMTADKAATELRFTLPAAEFGPVLDAASPHDRVRIAADADEGTVEVGPPSDVDGATDPEVTVSGDDFVTAPTCNLWVEDTGGERVVDRTAFEAALDPIAGTVRVGLATESGVNFAYEPADGDLTVWAKIDGDAVETGD